MVGTGGQGLEDCVGRRCIAESHCDVAQPAFMADPANRGAFCAGQEGCFVPGKKFSQITGIQILSRPEVIDPAVLGIAVPWADHLAVIAAIDTVAHRRSELLWDRALELDGE